MLKMLEIFGGVGLKAKSGEGTRTAALCSYLKTEYGIEIYYWKKTNNLSKLSALPKL